MLETTEMNGFTKEERFLNILGRKSFLRFWSWPNLFRNQGNKDCKGHGKEICDLVIIFGNHIILFSDKKILFNVNKTMDVAWSRWARRAIEDSVKQISGARRWISDYPDRIFLDPQCTKKLPLKIPPNENIIFHNILVCHGIEEILYTYNKEASFVFDNSIKGCEHWDNKTCRPFCIGQIFEGDFVHIFNESTIQLVLEELDTTKDFIYYLSQRESLLSSEKLVKVSSESDIIQLYYENFSIDLNKRSIWSEEMLQAKSLSIDKGGIEKLYTNPSFMAKTAEDEVSYFWDHLIESFSFHILNNTAEHKSWEHPSEIEPSIRYMAETGRFERRILATSFIDFYYKAIPGQRGTRLFFDPLNKMHAYLFLIVPFNKSFSTYEQYRETRRGMLQDYCIINKFINQKIKYIAGIACKTRVDEQPLNLGFFDEGQDFLFFDVSDWDDNDNAEANKIYDEYLKKGLFSNRQIILEKISEFPEDDFLFRRKIDVNGKDSNMLCICGSGKNIKDCCGKA